MREHDTPATPLAPVRERSVLPAGLELGLLLAVIATTGIFGGGAASGLLAGNGLATPGWAGISDILAGIIANPGDPAAAWPGEPRPGPAWLTWTCMIVVAIAVGATIAMARTEYDLRRRHRRTTTGMAKPTDLRRAGLDARSAVDKAAHEFPTLAQHAALPLARRLRVWRRWRR